MSQGDDGSKFNPAATAAAPTFVALADDVLKTHANDTSLEATQIKVEALSLAQFFKDWPTTRPSSEARLSAITRLMDLARRSSDYAGKKLPPPPNRFSR